MFALSLRAKAGEASIPNGLAAGTQTAKPDLVY
jgi:hypothetical protein